MLGVASEKRTPSVPFGSFWHGKRIKELCQMASNAARIVQGSSFARAKVGGLPGSGIAVMATAAIGLLARTKRSKCSKVASRAQPPGSNPMSVSMDEVRAAQRAWAETIKKISKIYLEGGDYVAEATKAAGELYGYRPGDGLFQTG
eukprot:Skav230176  [mRNA]  locus=scaffold196:70532:76860:- [translate_table: standard]